MLRLILALGFVVAASIPAHAEILYGAIGGNNSDSNFYRVDPDTGETAIG